MSNEFDATNDLATSLEVVDSVANHIISNSSLSAPILAVNNAISCSAVVLMSGYFESFLKDIICEFVDKLNSKNLPIAVIPQDMRLKHFSAGGEILRRAAKLDKKQGSSSNSDDLMSRIASLGNTTGYILVWEAFAETQSNPGPDVVKNILRGVGAEHTWDEINGLFEKHGSLNMFLESFIEVRNVCAHTGKHASPPTGQRLLEYSEKMKVLSECIDLLLAVRLEQFK